MQRFSLVLGNDLGANGATANEFGANGAILTDPVCGTKIDKTEKKSKTPVGPINLKMEGERKEKAKESPGGIKTRVKCGSVTR